MANVMGLDLSDERAVKFIQQYYEKANDGITFKGAWTNKNFEVSKDKRVLGHRHDQTAASVIAWKLGMRNWLTNWVSYEPNNKNPDIEKYKEMYPGEIFNKKGEIDETLIFENNLVDAVAHINEDIIKVEYDDTEFVFNIESWGQLQVKEILVSALDIFDSKLDELSKLIK